MRFFHFQQHKVTLSVTGTVAVRGGRNWEHRNGNRTGIRTSSLVHPLCTVFFPSEPALVQSQLGPLYRLHQTTSSPGISLYVWRTHIFLEWALCHAVCSAGALIAHGPNDPQNCYYVLSCLLGRAEILCPWGLASSFPYFFGTRLVINTVQIKCVSIATVPMRLWRLTVVGSPHPGSTDGMPSPGPK